MLPHTHTRLTTYHPSHQNTESKVIDGGNKTQVEVFIVWSWWLKFISYWNNVTIFSDWKGRTCFWVTATNSLSSQCSAKSTSLSKMRRNEWFELINVTNSELFNQIGQTVSVVICLFDFLTVWILWIHWSNKYLGRKTVESHLCLHSTPDSLHHLKEKRNVKRHHKP